MTWLVRTATTATARRNAPIVERTTAIRGICGNPSLCFTERFYTRLDDSIGYSLATSTSTLKPGWVFSKQPRAKSPQCRLSPKPRLVRPGMTTSAKMEELTRDAVGKSLSLHSFQERQDDDRLRCSARQLLYDVRSITPRLHFCLSSCGFALVVSPDSRLKRQRASVRLPG